MNAYTKDFIELFHPVNETYVGDSPEIREQIKTRIKDLGGKVLSSVSSNTDYVVAGEKPGSKYNKAKKLGVKVLEEKEFLKMVR